jgi:hypothetical protein
VLDLKFEFCGCPSSLLEAEFTADPSRHSSGAADSHLDTITLSEDFGCSVAEELLDEHDHLGLLDGAGVIFIESGEHLIESLVGELVAGAEVAEGVLDELLGLLLVEGAALVNVIGVPDLVNDGLDSLVFGA